MERRSSFSTLASQDSVRDLRRELDVLRQPDGEAAPRDPVGRAGLKTLIDRVRSGGLDVTVSAGEELDELPADVQRVAYRVVQESLTNVLRHAGAHAAAKVTLRLRQSMLWIDVTTTGSLLAAGQQGFIEGNGIRGMRARVAAFGGDLTAGRLLAGGFAVHAELPVPGT